MSFSKNQARIALAAALVFVPVAAGAADTPDLSGVWWGGTKPIALHYVGAKPELTPEGAQKFKETAKEAKSILASQKDLKDVRKCRLFGNPAIWQMPYPVEIQQRPELTAIAYEFQHAFRLVYMNEAPAKPDDVPSLNTLGHPVGHWDGDTLVIEDTAFNDKGFLTLDGLPHTEDLHMIERLRKIDGGKALEVTATIEDPKFYRKPWTVRTTLQSRPDVEMQEFTCGYGGYQTRYTPKPVE